MTADMYYQPTDPGDIVCRDCRCSIEDHNDPVLGGDCSCGDCAGFDEYSAAEAAEDARWDAADQAYAESKERFQ